MRSESEDGDDVSMNDNDGKGRKRKRGMRGGGRDSSNVNDGEASEELAKTAGSSNGGSGSVPSGNRGSDIKVSEKLAKVLQNGSLAEISAFFSERGLACGLSADKCIIYDGENKHGKSFKLSGVEAALKNEGVSSADIRKHGGAFHARVSTEVAGRICGGGNSKWRLCVDGECKYTTQQSEHLFNVKLHAARVLAVDDSRAWRSCAALCKSKIKQVSRSEPLAVTPGLGEDGKPFFDISLRNIEHVADLYAFYRKNGSRLWISQLKMDFTMSAGVNLELCTLCDTVHSEGCKSMDLTYRVLWGSRTGIDSLIKRFGGDNILSVRAAAGPFYNVICFTESKHALTVLQWVYDQKLARYVGLEHLFRASESQSCLKCGELNHSKENCVLGVLDSHKQQKEVDLLLDGLDKQAMSEVVKRENEAKAEWDCLFYGKTFSRVFPMRDQVLKQLGRCPSFHHSGKCKSKTCTLDHAIIQGRKVTCFPERYFPKQQGLLQFLEQRGVQRARLCL